MKNVDTVKQAKQQAKLKSNKKQLTQLYQYAKLLKSNIKLLEKMESDFNFHYQSKLKSTLIDSSEIEMLKTKFYMIRLNITQLEKEQIVLKKLLRAFK